MLLQEMYKLSIGESYTAPHRKHFVCIQRVTSEAFSIEIQDTDYQPVQQMMFSTKLLDLFKNLSDSRPAGV